MGKDFQIVQIDIDQAAIQQSEPRLRNQLFGCMHAQNELAVLNRILLFSMNNTATGDLHDSAQSIQMWCVLQLLAAKLVECWNLLNQRFLRSNPEDRSVAALKADQKESLEWLKEYFGTDKLKDSALKIIRDKTAFHYDKLNLEEAANNLGKGENSIYLAQHPANSFYYLGSSLVFRAVFSLVAKSQGVVAGTHDELTMKGFGIARDEVQAANWHMHLVFYGLIEGLLDVALGRPLATFADKRVNVTGAPTAEQVGLPVFIDIGKR